MVASYSKSQAEAWKSLITEVLMKQRSNEKPKSSNTQPYLLARAWVVHQGAAQAFLAELLRVQEGAY